MIIITNTENKTNLLQISEGNNDKNAIIYSSKHIKQLTKVQTF